MALVIADSCNKFSTKGVEDLFPIREEKQHAKIKFKKTSKREKCKQIAKKHIKGAAQKPKVPVQTDPDETTRDFPIDLTPQSYCYVSPSQFNWNMRFQDIQTQLRSVNGK